MLFLVCPCGEILGNKQLVYEQLMKKACDDIGVDFEMVSLGLTDKNKEFVEKRSEIVNKLCRRWCCKQLLITYQNIADKIKG